ncbi:MAG: tyrosine-type recombinase/integrase [Verrucomicrobiota bacterium]
MPSVHRDLRGKSPFWYGCFTLPDGTRVKKSTKQTSKREAQRVCQKWAEAAQQARTGHLTEAQARQVIGEIYEQTHGTSLPQTDVQTYAEQWLSRKKVEIADSSFVRYQDIIHHFLESLSQRATIDISRITAPDIVSFRDRYAKSRSNSTANIALKIIRMFFKQAKRDGYISENPAVHVDAIKRKGSATERRAFTLPEIKRLLKSATDEWQGIIKFGLYTGQRLGDIAGLTWSNIHINNDGTGELRLKTGKTGRRQILPMAQPLIDHCLAMKTADDPAQPLFPKAFATVQDQGGRTGTLSNQFRRILESSGLVQKRTNRSTGKGRSTSRQSSELSFHCLRHTTTSMMKNAGISPAIVQEFIGHDSEAISRQYTHIETDALKTALGSLPVV